MLEKQLHPLTDFVTIEDISQPPIVTYNYEGICPQTGKKIQLPRTILAEKIALNLTKQLETSHNFFSKGKMLGILIVQNQDSKLRVIKAFSGYLAGKKEVRGWVKQISGYRAIAMAEKLTLKQLDEIKVKLISLQNLDVRNRYIEWEKHRQIETKQLQKIHRQNKQLRDEKRQLTLSLEQREKLEQESRRDDWERRKLKHQWREKLQLLEAEINQADRQIQQLKRQRKELSRQLQQQMQTAYTLTNFTGNSLSVGQIIGQKFIPTGTGDCCAPKLLNHCATHNLIPVAMAEIWWGETSADGQKVARRFYPACTERCQPLMGFLLSGLPAPTPTINQSLEIPIIYEDDYLLAVNKPSGLLSVAGRGIAKFDSVVSRLRQIATANSYFYLNAIHRLDQHTSGILLLAKSKDIYTQVAQQFAHREVQKIYEAIVMVKIETDQGVIDLPLWSNPQTRPRQEINQEKGKPSVSFYRVLERQIDRTRVEFRPMTGRTHQLRIHSLSGLGGAIQGDSIYGNDEGQDDRLYLHAREIIFTHPVTGKKIHLQTKTPF